MAEKWQRSTTSQQTPFLGSFGAGLGAGTPTPSAAPGLRAGDQGQCPQPNWGIPWRRGAGGDTASPQSPICPPSISTAGQGLPDAPAGARCLSSPPFLKENKREREAAFWGEFLRVWLFRFPSSLRGPKKRGTPCQRRRLCKTRWLHGALGLHGSVAPKKAGAEGTQQGWRGHSGDTAPRSTQGCRLGHVIPAGCILRDAAGARRERRTAEGAAGQEERGHRRDMAGDTVGTGLEQLSSPQEGWKGDLDLPWAGMAAKGHEGQQHPGMRWR